MVHMEFEVGNMIKGKGPSVVRRRHASELIPGSVTFVGYEAVEYGP